MGDPQRPTLHYDAVRVAESQGSRRTSPVRGNLGRDAPAIRFGTAPLLQA